jgi:hypothetical protein
MPFIGTSLSLSKSISHKLSTSDLIDIDICL